MFSTKNITTNDKIPKMSRDELVQKIYEICKSRNWESFVSQKEVISITGRTIDSVNYQYGSILELQKAVAELYTREHFGELLPIILTGNIYSIRHKVHQDEKILKMWKQWLDASTCDSTPSRNSEDEIERYLANRLKNIRQGKVFPAEGEKKLLNTMNISIETTRNNQIVTPKEKIKRFENWFNSDNILPPTKNSKNDEEQVLSTWFYDGILKGRIDGYTIKDIFELLDIWRLINEKWIKLLDVIDTYVPRLNAYVEYAFPFSYKSSNDEQLMHLFSGAYTGKYILIDSNQRKKVIKLYEDRFNMSLIKLERYCENHKYLPPLSQNLPQSINNNYAVLEEQYLCLFFKHCNNFIKYKMSFLNDEHEKKYEDFKKCIEKIIETYPSYKEYERRMREQGAPGWY